MSGNVSEWCQDWYDNYSSIPQINPIGPMHDTHCVVRGGNYSGVEGDAHRVSGRTKYNPQLRTSILGLRLVLAIDDEFAE